MNGAAVLKAQLVVVHNMYGNVVGSVATGELAGRPAPGMNLIGYNLWHIPATQDWVAHVATRGLPEVRMQGRWANHAGINPNLPPFGCTLDEADAVARAVTKDELLEYEADVHAALAAWLDSLSDTDLETVPDLAANARRYPQVRITDDYLHEIADQMAWNFARFVSSPCVGHARGHFGELEVHLALLRA